jgi:predicted amidophosphoribosyltransferase
MLVAVCSVCRSPLPKDRQAEPCPNCGDVIAPRDRVDLSPVYIHDPLLKTFRRILRHGEEPSD